MPSRDELRSLIKSKPNYKHTNEELATTVLRRAISSKEGPRAVRYLDAINHQSKRQRESIAVEEGGRWESKREGYHRVYWFVKG